MRENIKKLPQLYFKGCGDCSERCEGKFFLAPLILEDFQKVEPYFEIKAIKLEGEIVPVMLLTDGENPCKYLNKGKCKIYENRPPACKIYPFSPFYDELFLDLSCQAISYKETILKLPRTKNEFLNSQFFEERVIDFKEKREKTLKYMKKQKLTFYKKIKGIELFNF